MEPTEPRVVRTRTDWVRLVTGLAVVFLLFHWSADALKSDRGQHGIILALIVLPATAAAQWSLHRGAGRSKWPALGLGWPRARALAAAVAITLALWLVAFLFVLARGLTVWFYPRWLYLLPGLFAQAGVAEEVLFRGYLFGNLRIGRTFWRAALLSMLPFTAVHLILFFSMPWPIALAAVLLAVIMSFPLACLYEVGGGTIWASALLHFVVQGTVKVLVVSPEPATFALAWMIASGLVPLLIVGSLGSLGSLGSTGSSKVKQPRS